MSTATAAAKDVDIDDDATTALKETPGVVVGPWMMEPATTTTCERRASMRGRVARDRDSRGTDKLRLSYASTTTPSAAASGHHAARGGTAMDAVVLAQPHQPTHQRPTSHHASQHRDSRHDASEYAPSVATTTRKMNLSSDELPVEEHKNSRRKRICLYLCVAAAAVMALLLVVVVPVVIKVVIPAAIQNAFASDAPGQSPLVITNLSFTEITNDSTRITFIAFAEGLNVPFNIPLRMIKPSEWTLSARYSNSSVSEDWYPIGRAPDVEADFLVHNGRVDLNATEFLVEIMDGGASLGQFLGGAAKFLKSGPSVIPYLKIEIEAGFWFGALYVSPLHLEKVVDVGKMLTEPAPSYATHKGTTTFSPGPLTVSDSGDVSADVQIFIPPPGTPMGVDFKNVLFNLAVDNDTFSRARIDTLKFVAGDTTLKLPLQFSSIGVGGLLSGFFSSFFVTTRTLRAFNLTALNGEGQDIPWLNTMFSYVDFEVPIPMGSGGSGALAAFIIGILGKLGTSSVV